MTGITLYLFKITFTKTEQGSAIHFRISTYIVMNKSLEWLIILVIPFFIRPITTFCYHFMRIPIFPLFRNKAAAFKNKNFFSCRSQLVSHSTATAAGANDDDIVMIDHGINY